MNLKWLRQAVQRLPVISSTQRAGLAIVVVLVFPVFLLGAQVDPAGFQAAVVEAGNLLQAQRYQEAAAIMERLREEGHSSALLSSTLGLAYQGLGRYSEAIIQFRKSLELDPDQPKTRVVLGTNLLLTGQTQEAIRELEDASRKLSDDVTVMEVLARAYLQSGRLLNAAITYQRLSEIRSDDPEIAYHLGQIYLELTEWSSAKLVEQGGDSPRVHQAAGQTSLMKGDLESAAQAFKQAIRLAPDMPDLHLSLASVYMRQGKLIEALEAVEAELKIVPVNVGAQQLKARLEQETEGVIFDFRFALTRPTWSGEPGASALTSRDDRQESESIPPLWAELSRETIIEARFGPGAWNVEL